MGEKRGLQRHMELVRLVQERTSPFRGNGPNASFGSLGDVPRPSFRSEKIGKRTLNAALNRNPLSNLH